MRYLKLGSQGAAVYWLRRNLNAYDNACLPDGDQFDIELEDAVIAFQTRYGLLADGIVGKDTRTKMSELYRAQLFSLHGQDGHFARRDDVPADVYKDGYSNFSVRADVAGQLSKVYEELHSVGALLTSAGGFRDLSVEANNSAMSVSSFHYTGRAIDLDVGSGMENPVTDPFVIVAEDGSGRAGSRLHRVYARAEQGQEMTLDPITYESPAGTKKPVTGNFVDLTALMLSHGFERIRAKPKFYDTKNYKASQRYLSAEWWHFQYQVGLLHHFTTFGDELKLVWSQNQLEASTPWRKCADYIFGENWN
jgi:hypothetical protein